MYPAIPTELTQSAVQLVMYFFTVVGALLGLLTSGRA
jgi:hypothetical protein